MEVNGDQHSSEYLKCHRNKKKLLEHIEVENMIEVLLSQKHY